MRRASSIHEEIQKGAKLSEELSRQRPTFLDTKKLTAQAQLVGILKALAWATGHLKKSPVDELLKELGGRR